MRPFSFSCPFLREFIRLYSLFLYTRNIAEKPLNFRTLVGSPCCSLGGADARKPGIRLAHTGRGGKILLLCNKASLTLLFAASLTFDHRK